MNKVIYFFALVFLSHIAEAEVMEKFGGCKYPEVLLYLLGFFMVIIIFCKIKKRAIALLWFLLSLFYITFYVLFPYLGYVGVSELFADSARSLYIEELRVCPQYKVFGYWEQSWIAIIAYLICSLILLFGQGSKKAED